MLPPAIQLQTPVFGSHCPVVHEGSAEVKAGKLELQILTLVHTPLTRYGAVAQHGTVLSDGFPGGTQAPCSQLQIPVVGSHCANVTHFGFVLLKASIVLSQREDEVHRPLTKGAEGQQPLVPGTCPGPAQPMPGRRISALPRISWCC